MHPFNRLVPAVSLPATNTCTRNNSASVLTEALLFALKIVTSYRLRLLWHLITVYSPED